MNTSRRDTRNAQQYIAAEEAKVQAQVDTKVAADKKAVDVGLRLFYIGPIGELKESFHSNPSGGIDSYKFSGLTRGKAQSLEDQKSAFLTFIDELAAEGTQLTESGGAERLAFYMFRQGDVFADLSSTVNWHRGLARLRELNVFAEGEIVTVEKPAAPPRAETQEELMSAIEKVDTSSREGTKKARRLVEQGFVNEKQPLFSRFISHMRSKPWHHPMTKTDQQSVTDFLVAKNLGLTEKSLDLARQQVLGCRTDDERLAHQIENDSRQASDYNFKREIRNQQLKMGAK